MRKKKEQKNKLSRSVVLSIILHVLLFAFIVLYSLKQIIKLGGDKVVETIMVNDPGAVIKQYNQLQQQQNNTKQAEAKRKKPIQQQEEKLLKQEEEEQKQLKTVKDERIKIEREAEKQAKEQQKRTEKSAIAKAKPEQERLIKDQAEKNARAKKEAEIINGKAQAEKKEKAEKQAKILAAKKKADAEKQYDTLDSMISKLTHNNPSQQTGTTAASRQGENRKSEASSSDLDNYAGKIKIAIESKFYDADIYHGKICELRIKLAPDGMLISIAAKNNIANDQSLCDAAIRATKTAIMPKPPSRSIYDAFNEQGSALVFKP
ncbi:MAG: cell envelope integrity protein TolA [Arsenophonus sp.]